MVKRIYVQKKKGFDIEAKGLLEDIKENLLMDNLEDVILFNRYDVEGITGEVFEEAKNTVFSEPQVDECFVEDYPFDKNDKVFGVEYLPGQFDQRANSLSECLQILTEGVRPASNGANILILSTITMVFISLNYVIEGGLYGFGKVHIPAIALGIGAVIKLVMNVILISNPAINILGAVISSIICQILLFIICIYYLYKEIKLDLRFKNHILKPTFASAIMSVIAYTAYKLLMIVAGNAISTIAAIIVGAVSYVIIVLLMKILTKEDIYMIPFGTKIYNVLVKLKIYKEEEENA